MNTEKIIVSEYAFGWSATREDYCGCGECHCPIGIGMTKEAAIADLLQSEELREDA